MATIEIIVNYRQRGTWSPLIWHMNNISNSSNIRCVKLQRALSHFSPPRPSEAYIPPQTRPSLVKITTCSIPRRFRKKKSSFLWEPWEQIIGIVENTGIFKQENVFELSFAKWLPFCAGLNELILTFIFISGAIIRWVCVSPHFPAFLLTHSIYLCRYTCLPLVFCGVAG